MEDIEGKGSASQNSELLKHWWDCSTACELVDGANYSEPCLEQTRSYMQVLDTKFFRLENPLQSSHRHGTLHWEGYRTMWQEKKQHWSKCTPYFMLQWSMEQNSAELCLEGPAFTSKLQEWGNSNILPTTEKREGVSLSCVKRWQSTGREAVVLHTLCGVTTSQFPGNTLVYLTTAWCLGDTSSWLHHKKLTQNSVFNIFALPMVLLGSLRTAKF